MIILVEVQCFTQPASSRWIRALFEFARTLYLLTCSHSIFIVYDRDRVRSLPSISVSVSHGNFEYVTIDFIGYISDAAGKLYLFDLVCFILCESRKCLVCFSINLSQCVGSWRFEFIRVLIWIQLRQDAFVWTEQRRFIDGANSAPSSIVHIVWLLLALGTGPTLQAHNLNSWRPEDNPLGSIQVFLLNFWNEIIGSTTARTQALHPFKRSSKFLELAQFIQGERLSIHMVPLWNFPSHRHCSVSEPDSIPWAAWIA